MDLTMFPRVSSCKSACGERRCEEVTANEEETVEDVVVIGREVSVASVVPGSHPLCKMP